MYGHCPPFKVQVKLTKDPGGRAEGWKVKEDLETELGHLVAGRVGSFTTIQCSLKNGDHDTNHPGLGVGWGGDV